MKGKRLFLTCSLMLTIVVAPVSTASAEWFVDAYIGAAFTQGDEISFRSPVLSGSFEEDFPTTFVSGGRLGYWFERVPWIGLGIDGSHFRFNDDLRVVPVSALLMLRLPLFLSKALPKGQLQPYFAIGPGLFISRVDLDLRPGLPASFSDRSSDVGVDTRLGLALQVVSNVALFSEYRYTRVSPDFKSRVLGVEVSADTALKTHHLLAGISLRF